MLCPGHSSILVNLFQITFVSMNITEIVRRKSSSQITDLHYYIKLKWSTDDEDSRKHSLKKLCLKCHNLVRNR